ncbi:MAG: single-stranded DNA-binding protein [Candidatus Sericytochromatia bacterium]
MAQANNVIVITGRAGRDPEVRTVGDSRMVASVTVAVNRPTKDQDGNYITDWFTCEFWGKQGDLLGEMVKKGSLITVSGSVRIDKWETNGEKKTRYFILGDTFQIHSSKNEGSSDHEHHSHHAPEPVARKAAPAPASKPAAKAPPVDDFELDDDLPPF